jgi:hypothetical protein
MGLESLTFGGEMRVALLIAAVLCAAFTQQASGRDLSAEQATRLERDVSDLKRDNIEFCVSNRTV